MSNHIIVQEQMPILTIITIIDLLRIVMDTAIINLITVVDHILQIGIPLLTTITTTKSKPCL